MLQALSKKQKKLLQEIIYSGICVVVILLLKQFIPKFELYWQILMLIPYWLVGGTVLKQSWKGIQNKQIFDENFLMAVATIGAILLGEVSEGIAVMMFYQIGELFQSIAVGKSRDSIQSLMDINAEYANVIQKNGEIQAMDPEDVPIGSYIIVKAGEKVPLDGIIVSGSSSLNQSALTGESIPKDVSENDMVLSGTINLNGFLKIRTTRLFEDSTASKILELVESASDHKAKVEAFIKKFAAVYTPIVVYSAIALAFLPPIVQVLMGKELQITVWVLRSLTFLVISCPCALVLSVPLSFFAGIGCASKYGILMKGSNYLELLSEVSTIVMDKTGTLTQAKFKVHHIQSEDVKLLLNLAANVEAYSNHPIAECIVEANLQGETLDIQDVKEIAGKGMVAYHQKKEILIGNAKLLHEHGVIPSIDISKKISATILYVAYDGKYLGYIEIKDMVKDNAYNSIQKLHQLSVKNIIMLTGDTEEVAKEISEQLHLDAYYAGLLPQDKVKILSDIQEQKKSIKKTTAFIGDGLNDAPSLALADIGIAMGALGSDAAIEAADVVLTDDNLDKISLAIQISRKTMWIVKENIVFAIGIKILFLVMSALGYTNMWWAIFSDVGVMVLAVINASRCLHYSYGNTYFK